MLPKCNQKSCLLQPTAFNAVFPRSSSSHPHRHHHHQNTLCRKHRKRDFETIRVNARRTLWRHCASCIHCMYVYKAHTGLLCVQKHTFAYSIHAKDVLATTLVMHGGGGHDKRKTCCHTEQGKRKKKPKATSIGGFHDAATHLTRASRFALEHRPKIGAAGRTRIGWSRELPFMQGHIAKTTNKASHFCKGKYKRHSTCRGQDL